MRTWLTSALVALIGLSPMASSAAPLPSAPAAAAHLSPGSPIPPAELEALVDGVIRQGMLRDHVAGVSVSVVQDGQVLLKKGYGFAAPGKAVDPDQTLFRIGSISKTFTWIAVMKEVEAGRMSLDGPINRYLPPGLAIPDDGFAQPIRIRDLMSHTPGFEDRTFDHLFIERPADIWPLARQLAEARPRRVFAPGTTPAYSNYGAMLAGEAVANLEKSTYQSVVEREIIGPLGLAHTTFREPYPARADLPAPMAAELAADRSTGYRWSGAGFEPQPYEYITHAAPAGAGSSTAADMARYMSMMLGDGQLGGVRIYSPETALGFRTPLPTPAPGLRPFDDGFMEFQLPGGFLGHGHGGDTLAFHSMLVTVPELRLGVFATANTDTGGRLVRELPERIVEHFYAAPQNLPLPGSPALAAQRDVYAGTYLTNRRPFGGLEKFVMMLVGQMQVSVSKDGRLLAAGSDGDQGWVPAGAPGKFKAVDGPSTIAFLIRGGRAVRFYEASGTASADRIGPIYQRSVLMLLAALTALAAVVTAIGPALRFRRGLAQTPGQRRASQVQIAAAALWLVACLGMAAFAAAASNPAELVRHWPGAPLITTSVAALAAAVLSAIGIVLLPFAWLGAGGWGLWRKLRTSATTLLFAALALQLAFWGLLQPWAT